MKIDRVSLPLFENGSLLQPIEKVAGDNNKSFGEMLTSAISEVNGYQRVAEQKNIDLAAGRIEDISEVMIAAEKASIALQLTNQVRNKVVDAYQEIMRMSM